MVIKNKGGRPKVNPWQPLPPPRMEEDKNLRGVASDKGCDVAPKCLTCHLPKCKFDDPVGYQQWLKRASDKKIVELRRKHTVTEVSRMTGMERRSIERIMARVLGALPLGQTREGFVRAPQGRRPVQ